MVGEEHQQRRHRAITIVQAISSGNGVVQHVLVARQGFPFQVALVHAFDHLTRHGDHGNGRLHAFGVLHLPHQLIHGRQRRISRATFSCRLDHDHQYIGAGGVIADDEVVIQVVARIRVQLRRALVEVTDLKVLPVPHTTGQRRDCNHHGNRGHHRVRAVGDKAPEWVLLVGFFATDLHRLLADTDIGNHDRQQNQVGQNDHRHTHGCADGQLTDHTDINQQQGDKAHGVR